MSTQQQTPVSPAVLVFNQKGQLEESCKKAIERILKDKNLDGNTIAYSSQISEKHTKNAELVIFLPKVSGRRCMPASTVLERIKELAKRGVKVIVLTPIERVKHHLQKIEGVEVSNIQRLI